MVLFPKGYHELQHDEEKDDMLDQAIKFLEKLPENMKRPFGKIVYNDLAFKIKPRTHTLKTVTRIIIILGILYLLYRRFFKKK